MKTTKNKPSVDEIGILFADEFINIPEYGVKI